MIMMMILMSDDMRIMMTRVKRMRRNEDDDDKDEEGGCFMRMRVQRRAGYVTAIQQMDKSLTLLIILTLMYVYIV